MSNLSTIHEKVVTLQAGERRDLEIGVADVLFFRVFPDGLTASINDLAPVALPEGLLQKGPPGAGIFRQLAVINPTAGPLTMRLLYGLGDITVAGAVALIGSVPLPTGAATGAKQDTGNASLAAMDAKLGAIDDLAANTVETPDLVTLGASADETYAGLKRVTVLNTNTAAEDVTLNFAGGADRVLAPGQSASFPVTKPLATVAAVRVRTTAGGSALVSTMT